MHHFLDVERNPHDIGSPRDNGHFFCMLIDIQMGHSQAEKAESHDRIVRTAAARFRQMGLDGLSVADLMKEAGLTHGGFYRHFESREDLVAEAVSYALAEGDRQVGLEPRPPEGELTIGRMVDAYLAEAHKDAPAAGCAVAALAGDVARSGGRTRSAFSRQAKRSFQSIANMLSDDPNKRAHAILIWCALVGALTLARGVNDRRLSSEILDTVRSEVKLLFGGGRRKK